MIDVPALSKRIAADLMVDLRSGKLAKVGIEEVREAIAKETANLSLDPWTIESLEIRTLRAFISGV
ncbi:hypothetical protein HNQ36_001097 [Afipia massiliensis]|uniref:Uncharacterized protein n=1 Tax=Afipia massiliensis TaxID=211460 RepID=A0A840MT72_9BRAD|nr:hypothetical protein [Afipia massiliensis]MBB5051143.1 hypothetical protein [Afipia massiliensis]